MTNTSSSSKVLGVRMPFPEYMELLQNAQENKMTISDFALQLILHNKNKPQQTSEYIDLKEQIKTLSLENAKLKREINQTSEAVNKRNMDFSKKIALRETNINNLKEELSRETKASNMAIEENRYLINLIRTSGNMEMINNDRFSSILKSIR